MKIRSFCLMLVICMSFTAAVSSSPKYVDDLAGQAVSDNPAAATDAVRELRIMGGVGLDALFVKYAAEIERFKRTGEADANWIKIANAIDTVAQQKDAYASHLYWYTDLDEAKRVAKAKNKPILSLRLLGNLNEEFSCANSRLFRAVLYPNVDVSKYLRDNYILHWRSVRPAPRITIDFGDGRKIERTVTGNSIHYILDENGAIIDALPGLYGPKAFLKYITGGREMTRTLRDLPKEARLFALLKYRKTNFDQIKKRREKAVEIAKVHLTEIHEDPVDAAETSVTGKFDATVSYVAARGAVSKLVVVDEYSILRVYDEFAKFEGAMNFNDWNKLSKLYSPALKIDENSIAFIRRQNAKSGLTENEFAGLFTKLDRFIALDTTRNDFLYHTRLYQWLNEDRGGEALDQFNDRVYADIFRTSNSDKWLGLYSSDVYTALDGNGIIK